MNGTKTYSINDTNGDAVNVQIAWIGNGWTVKSVTDGFAQFVNRANVGFPTPSNVTARAYKQQG